MLNSLIIESRTAVEMAGASRAEREAKKKAVPKF
jgi:hypothetical protein